MHEKHDTTLTTFRNATARLTTPSGPRQKNLYMVTYWLLSFVQCAKGHIKSFWAQFRSVPTVKIGKNK